MRRFLDRLYDTAAVLAAVCIIGVLVTVIAGVVSRESNMFIPGTDSYAGYLMAGAGFLAMAHTLKRNEHIRVTLLINAASPRVRRALEIFSLGAAVLLSGLFAYYSARFAWQSYLFNDISTGNDAAPLWIPELSMVVGSFILLVAFIDEFVLELLGRRQHRRQVDEILRNE
ncbi:MAG: TRAP transporter small permease [Burkholderiaceae bacterium]|nr:TRAP transporter small permease [Burkholderiaceae bacterium]